MKVTVEIEGQPFEVKIEDLYQRPVIATVDGERFEVWPEGQEPFKVKLSTPNGSAAPLKNGRSNNGPVKNAVVAPIPGLIVSISIKRGDEVTQGQGVCVLEAMKMKNTIRSPRAGRIADVCVAAGQQVGEGDVIIAFEEAFASPV